MKISYEGCDFISKSNYLNFTSAVEKALQSFEPVPLGKEDYNTQRATLESFPFFVSIHGVCKICKGRGRDSYYIQPVSSYVRTKYKVINKDKSEAKICLELDNGAEIVQCLLDRTVLTRQGVKDLLKLGVCFHEHAPDMLLEYLVKSDKQAQCEQMHSQLGWDTIDGVAVFKLYNIIYPGFYSKPSISEYNGTIDVKPKGSLDKWLDMVKADVLPYTPLTFVMMLGFASPILATLTDKYDLGSPVFCLTNESSKGKTSSAMLATSVFSNPILGKGTMHSFFETENFLTAFLASGGALPIAFDEGATYKGDMQRLLYLLAGGRDKGRLNSDSTMKPERAWKNIIITTAEFDLASESSPNGITARCFNITDALTESAEHSDRIKSTVTKNYGLAGTVFIQWILDNRIFDIESDYEKCKQELYGEATEANVSTLTKRILAKFSVILQAALYVKDCFKFNIDIREFKKYLFKLESAASRKTDFADTALDLILQEVSRNSSRYLTSDNMCCHNVIGKITEDNTMKKVYIIKSEFERICQKNGLPILQVLNKLRQADFLECESDRYSKRVRLETSIPQIPTCYVLKIPDPKSHREFDTSARIANNIVLQDDEGSHDESFQVEYVSDISDEDLEF